jgi:two-component system, cell cycle response regulator
VNAFPFHPQETVSEGYSSPSPTSPALAGEPARAPAIRVPLEVLVVDDEETSRDVLAMAVRSYGHHCRTAVCGEDALRAIAERHPDVVISDWEMPGMNGAELCRRTRNTEDDSPYTYFIILSAFSDRAHLLAGMEAGADDYQRKPLDLDELEARLLSAARVVELHRRLASRTAELRHDSTRFYAASRTDALTGVGNRLRLDEEVSAMLSRAARYGHRCALAICDLDFFKAFNDRYGHVAGDEALRRVATGMRANLRAADTVFRYGGEEFVVLLVEQSLADATFVMDRMRAEIERLAIASPATGGALTVSVGVAEVDPNRDSVPADWIARADAALYVAKSQGRNRVIATPSLASADA